MAISVYQQVKKALQDIIAPELKEIKVEIKRLDDKITVELKGIDDKIGSLEGKTMSEIKRLEDKIDTLNNKIEVAMEIRERLKAVEAKVGII
jgi:DNA repair exonuclease SbcCD ATPase subunit